MSKRLSVAIVVLVAFVACGDHDHDGSGAAGGHEHDAPAGGHDHSHDYTQGTATSFVFGAPGDPAAATLTVEVVAADPYSFEPEDLKVGPGETVTFVVTNEGKQAHEFVLGDREYQQAHEEQMASGSMHHAGNAIVLAPGQTQELTWAFPTEGEVFYGCHVAGHYEGGMVGAIRITA
jgi:uncharacterized cupredoxin-like copper-binding protein